VRVRLIFEKINTISIQAQPPFKTRLFTLVGFLKVILKTLEGCEISGG